MLLNAEENAGRHVNGIASIALAAMPTNGCGGCRQGLRVLAEG